MTLSFKLARQGQEQAIAEMRIASAEKLGRALGPGSWSGTTSSQTITQRIRGADPENLRAQTIFVALRNDDALGSVVVTTFLPSFLKGKNWREPKARALGVFSLVVHPTFHRHGIGRFLMAGVEDLASSHGIPFVRLDAFEANPGAMTFYRTIGYNERGTIMLRTTPLVLFEKQVCLPDDSFRT